MIKNGVLMAPSWISFRYSHGKKELHKTEVAIKKSMMVYKRALKEGVNKYLKSHEIKPVFRKFN